MVRRFWADTYRRALLIQEFLNSRLKSYPNVTLEILKKSPFSM